MAQLMPLPLTVSCSSKIQIGFTFLVLAYPGCPGKEAVKWLYCSVVVVCWTADAFLALAAVHLSTFDIRLNSFNDMSVFSFIQQRDTAGIILLLSAMLRPVVAGHPVASAAVQYLLLTRCSAAYLQHTTADGTETDARPFHRLCSTYN